MTDVHLLQFIELTLKSKKDFSAAYDIVLSTRMSDYLKKFLVIQPGDWPAQFYSRQIIYETLQKYYRSSPDTLHGTPIPTDHEYTTPFNSGYRQWATAEESPAHINSQPAILSLIPCIGPLHISLNGRETVFKDFVGFFENIYNNLFPRSKLPKTPRPWRISLILEVVYGGWLFIREAPGQVNLDVREAIATRSDQFSLMITEDIGIFSTEFLLQCFDGLTSSTVSKKGLTLKLVAILRRHIVLVECSTQKISKLIDGIQSPKKADYNHSK